MTYPIGAQLTALSVPGYGYAASDPYFGRYGAMPVRTYGPIAPYGRVYFGAEEPFALPQRSGLTPPVAPILAPSITPSITPSTNGVMVRKHLDENQVLHVEICVDGKCYRTSMDLAPGIAMLMQKLVQWHDGMHAPKAPPPETVVSTIENAISATGDQMAGMLIGQHVAVGSWLSDIGNALGGTLRKLGPVISVVATGVATAYGGPAAGAAAGQLAPVITNLQANALDPKGDPKKKAAAAAELQRINQQAASDPDPAAAQAVNAANQAVRNTAIAYTVQDTAAKATAGDPAAQQEISNLVQSAEAGDPAAKPTYEAMAAMIAQELMKSETGAKLWEQVTGRGPGTLSGRWYGTVGARTHVGGFWDNVKETLATVTLTKATNQFIKDNKLEPYVQMAADAISSYYGGPAGVAASRVVTPMMMSVGVDDKQEDAAAQQQLQQTTQQAQQNPQTAQIVEIAKGAAESAAASYHVAQMIADAKAGDPVAQQSLANLRQAAASGDVGAQQTLQLAETIERQRSAPAPNSGAPYDPNSGPPYDPNYAPSVNGWHEIANAVIGCGLPQPASVGRRYSLVGGPVDDLREKARAHAFTRPGNAAAVIMTVDGRVHGRGFRRLDDAIDWLQHITRNRGAFAYAAAYEKDRAGNAYIQDEEFGRTQPTQMALR